jgi:beta-glucosidase
MDTLAKKIGGLDGFIVSDYGTTNQLCEYRFAENRKQATARAVNAGLDMDMGSGCFAEHLEELVKEGSVPISRIDDAVLRILRTKLRLDLWNRPLKAVTDKSTYSIPQEFKSAAVEAARKAAILLKNDGPILPLAKDLKKLAVIGPYTEATGELFGTWVLDGMAGFVTPVIKALRERMPGTEIKAVNSPFPDLMLWETKTFDDVVYLAGEHSSRSGERENLTSIGLPEGQEELILTLSRLGKRIILVVVAGRPLNLSRVLPHVAAVLYVFHPGTGGGEAIADILTGAGEPGGRLPMTFPRTEGQIPLYYNAFQERKNRPDHLRYIDMTEKPLFPFGYGLTYTDFRVSDIRIDKTEISLAGSVKVSVELANTGSREGEAVVQCYIQDCVASLIRPIRELKGCQRVKVGPNGVRRAEFVLGPDELGFYLPDGQWTVEPGTFKVFVGLDSRAELSAEFRVK